MKGTAIFLRVLAVLLLVAAIVSASEANEYYMKYRSSYYGYSSNSTGKIMGDAYKTLSFIAVGGAVVLLFAAHALSDAASRLEEICRKVVNIEEKQTHEFEDLQKYLEDSSKVYMRKFQEIIKSRTANRPEEGANKDSIAPTNLDEKTPAAQAKRSRTARLTSAPPDNGSLSDIPDRQ